MQKSATKDRSMKYIFTIVISIFCSFLSAQTPIYETIDISDGLPTNYVYRVLETQDGYVWMITERGVCRYDGLEFVCYNSNNGLPDNDYYLIYEDPIGRLWVNGLSQTLSCFYEDSIYNVHFLNRNHIDRMTINDSMIYFHDDGKVISVDPEFNVDRYDLSEFDREGNPLYKFFENNSESSYTVLKSQDLLTNSIIGLTHSKGFMSFYYFDSIKENYVKKKLPQINPEFSCVLQHSYVDDKIQIFDADHLVITDTQISQFDTIHIEVEETIPTNSAYLDSKNNLWISTKKGILVQHNKEREFDLLQYEETKNQNITHITNYKDDYVFANDNEQIFLSKDGKISNIFTEELSSRNNFYDVKISDSKLYFSNGANGLTQYEFKSNFQNYLFGNTILKSRKGIVSFSLKQFDIFANYAFSLLRGLYIFDLNRKVAVEIENDVYTKILYNPIDSMIWVSDKDNLIGYKFYEEEFDARLKVKYDIRNIEDLFLLENGNILASCFSGLNFICGKNGFQQDEIFVNERINACKKHDGYYYISTALGLYKIKGMDFSSRSKVFDYRILGPKYFINDFILHDDRFVLATNNGIVSALQKKDLISRKEYDFPFFIDSINSERPLRILKNGELKLPYHKRNFTINYHSNIYTKVKDYTYEYQLIGFDSKSFVTDRRVLNYSNLNSGNYSFKIRALDRNGNATPYKMINIKVEYPWWLKWYSLVVWAAVILGLVYLARLYSEKNIDKQIKYTRKLAELELNALQSQMNPHFVFNALNSIQNLVISNKIELADKYLSSFSQLMRLFLESAKNKFIPLAEELLIIKRYLEIEKLRFNDKLSYEIRNELTDLDQKVLVPATILQPFVENALVHGLFHKIGPGHLDILIKSEVDFIWIIITDDGVGRAFAENMKGNRTYKSRGMEIINDKLNLLKKIEDVDISYEIKDLDANDQKGTEVTIKIVNK